MIIVTGASRGIGQAIFNELSSQSEKVLGLARTADSSRNILSCDVSSYQSIKTVVAEIKKKSKSIKALIHAAGIASMNLALTTPEAVIQRLIKTNLMGTIFVNQLFTPLLIRSGGGRIINFSTIAVSLGLKGESIYVASKAGVEGFSRAFAREVSDFGITVNCIAPGPIKTDLLRGVSEEQIKKIVRRQIFTKIFSVVDVVNVVKMLLSEQAQYITGQTIHIGGV